MKDATGTGLSIGPAPMLFSVECPECSKVQFVERGESKCLFCGEAFKYSNVTDFYNPSEDFSRNVRQEESKKP